jgi:hypothetical protein
MRVIIASCASVLEQNIETGDGDQRVHDAFICAAQVPQRLLRWRPGAWRNGMKSFAGVAMLNAGASFSRGSASRSSVR